MKTLTRKKSGKLKRDSPRITVPKPRGKSLYTITRIYGGYEVVLTYYLKL